MPFWDRMQLCKLFDQTSLGAGWAVVLGPNFLYGTFNFELIKELHPDIVIFQFTERFLHAPFGVPIGADTANDVH
jgi:hypothetical protein